MKVTDQTVLARYKLTGMKDHMIAEKMGISVAEVQKLWTEMREAAHASDPSGYQDLIAHMNVLCYQYQLFGESLKAICRQLGCTVTASDLKAQIVKDDPDKTASNILQHYIVTKAFVKTDPVEALEKHLHRIIEGN